MDEDNLQKALDVEEMEKTAGWKLVRDQIESEIATLEADLGRIQMAGRSPVDIGSDYITTAQGINGLKRVLEIIEDIKAHKEQ